MREDSAVALRLELIHVKRFNTIKLLKLFTLPLAQFIA